MKKTNYMVFTKRKTPKFEYKLQIDGEDIKEVHETMFLGVITDNKLTWKEHISYICGKISRGIGMISRPDTILTKMVSWHCITHLYIHILCIAIKFGALHFKPIYSV